MIDQTTPRSLKILYILIIAALILSATFSTTPARAKNVQQTDSSAERAEALLETLLPEERVGQLFLVSWQGASVTLDSPIHDLIINHHIGGVILTRVNNNFTEPPNTPIETWQLIRAIQTTEWSASQENQVDPSNNQESTPAFIPMFVGISQEGNGPPYDQIFNGLTSLPSEMALGATWQPDLAYQVGSVLGNELSSLGFNLLVGPSLDVLDTPRTQGTGDLGVRTFGGDPYWVGEMGKSFISGVHEGSNNKIAVISKYFPGHGGSDRLPEVEVATVRKSLDGLKQIELAPFFAVTGNAPSQSATTDGLLTAHIRYQGLQGNIRETTRPVSLDRQALDQLLGLDPLLRWRETGGVLITDDLGSEAFRRFVDPSGENFQARFIARDAFLAGNDLLYLGDQFMASADPDTYTTIVNTLSFFAQKYREDPAFQEQVDQSVLRILTLKFRLYGDAMALSQVLVGEEGLANLGKSSQTTFQVAQQSATLISPALSDLQETLPEPPQINDRVVFISDVRTAKQCITCQEQNVFSVNALEQAVFRLYGPMAGGQVLQRNLRSHSFEELQALLDQNPEVDYADLDSNLQQAQWIIFSLLNVSTTNPTSEALSNFLALRPDLYRQKKIVVFAFDAPYFLDATEISKLNAYYGLYSKTPQFIEIAARLLFGELPSPPGSLPVSVAGVDYDLITATAPNPNIPIELIIDQPENNSAESSDTPTPVLEITYKVGDLIPVRTGIILDHNGHPVPDNTPVEFLATINGITTAPQTQGTIAGVSRISILVEESGLLEINCRSDQAVSTNALQFEIPPEEFPLTETLEVPTPTITASPQPSLTPTKPVIVTPTPKPPSSPDMVDWFLAAIISAGIGMAIYWISTIFGQIRWALRSAFLALIGGLLAYSYMAFNLPGTPIFIQSSGTGGIILITILGAISGWGVGFVWQKIVAQTRTANLSH